MCEKSSKSPERSHMRRIRRKGPRINRFLSPEKVFDFGLHQLFNGIKMRTLQYLQYSPITSIHRCVQNFQRIRMFQTLLTSTTIVFITLDHRIRDIISHYVAAAVYDQFDKPRINDLQG